MSTDALFWALKQKTGRPVENLVLIHLADRAGHNNTAFPSLAYLSDRTGLNRRTIISALDGLEIGGYVFDTGERKGGTGKVKVYGLNLNKPMVQEEILLDEIVHDFPEMVHKSASNSAGKCTQILLDTTKDTKNITPISPTPYFDEFWEIYPKAVAKKKCLEMWKKRNFDAIAETILDDVRRKSKSEAWTKERGAYVPMSTTYLNQERWNDKPQQQAQPRERGMVF